MIVEEVITMQINFQGLGWDVKIRKRRYTYSITLAKELILGNMLKQGTDVFYYLVKYNGRNAVLLFLDGEKRDRDHQKPY